MDSSSSLSVSNSAMSASGAFFGKEICYLCKRNSEDSAKIHACKFCGKTVCSEHSMRRRDLSEQVQRARICDKCHRDIIGAGVRGERKAELKCMKRQLEDFHRNMERRSQDLAIKREKVAEKRTEIATVRKSAEETQRVTQAKLEELASQLQSQRQTLSHLKDAVRINQLNVRSLRESICEKRAIHETLSREILTLHSQLPEYEKAVLRTSEKLAKYISKSEAVRLLCPKCNPNFTRMMISGEINRSHSRSQENKACQKCTVM